MTAAIIRLWVRSLRPFHFLRDGRGIVPAHVIPHSHKDSAEQTNTRARRSRMRLARKRVELSRLNKTISPNGRSETYQSDDRSGHPGVSHIRSAVSGNLFHGDAGLAFAEDGSWAAIAGQLGGKVMGFEWLRFMVTIGGMMSAFRHVQCAGHELFAPAAAMAKDGMMPKFFGKVTRRMRLRG